MSTLQPTSAEPRAGADRSEPGTLVQVATVSCGSEQPLSFDAFGDMNVQEPTPRQKLRFWSIVFAPVLILFGIVTYALITETTSGTVHSVEELSRVYAGGSQSFHGYPHDSALGRFPFIGDIAWKRMQLRPQIHLTGQVDIKRLKSYLATPPARLISQNAEEIVFTITESNVLTEGEVDLATATARLYCFDAQRKN